MPGEGERRTDGLRATVVGEGLGDTPRTEGLRTDGLMLERLCDRLGSTNFGVLLLDRGALTAGLDDRDENDGLKLRKIGDGRGADENEREGDRLMDALGLGRLIEGRGLEERELIRGLDDRDERDTDGDRLAEREEPLDDPRGERAITVVSARSSRAATKATRHIRKLKRCVNMTTPRPVGVESAGEATRQTT